MSFNPKTYNWWRAQIASQLKPNEFPPPVLEVGVAYPGHYRWATRNGVKPVSVWVQDDQTLYRIGTSGPVKYADDTFCENVFSWCCRKAITQEQLDNFSGTGRWFDEPPPVIERPGSNLPDNFIEAMRERLKGEIDEIKRFLAEPLTTQDQVDRASNWASRLIREIRDPVEENRKREKQPFLDEARSVDDMHVPIRDAANQWQERLKDATKEFLVAKKRAHEEAQRVAMEAEKKRLAEAAERGEEAIPERISTRQPYQEKPKASAGTVGSRTSVREVRTGAIEDWAAFTKWLLDSKQQDFMASCQGIADRLARAKSEAPGMKIVITEKVQ